GTLRAEIDVPNSEGKLLPGMYAVAAITTSGPVDDPKKEPRPKEAASADLKGLLQANVLAARTAYEESVRALAQARRVGTGTVSVGRPQEACTWSVHLLHAERDASDKKDDHTAALQRHLQRMKDIEQRAQEMYKGGLVPSLEVRAVEFHRVQ